MMDQNRLGGPLARSGSESMNSANGLRESARLVPILAGLTALAFILASAFGASARDLKRDIDPGPITGQWVNAVETPLCNPTTTRVCAEWLDDEEFSPLTGMTCCVSKSELNLGLWSSCEQLVRNPPREE